MLDINRIRENPKEVADALAKRACSVDFTELLRWDRERREGIANVEKMKAERNKGAADVARAKAGGLDCAQLISQMKSLSDRIRELDAIVNESEIKIGEYLGALPNITDDDVAAGGKENNEELRTWGKKPEFSFQPKNHVDLVSDLGLIDYERGVKLGGAGYWLYKGDGAKLEWALLNYFVEEHIKDGYQFILPPHILNYSCGYTAGQFPKFLDDVFAIESDRGDEDSVDCGANAEAGRKPDATPQNMRFILPTAETALVNVHRDEILAESDLPLKYFAYTPCYRKEAGSARAEERGMVRGHQFNKVEMVQYTTPEGSDAALDELVSKAERLLQGLGLHYRVSKLAAEDVSASMAKTLDIEVWLPSMGIYKEVSSASNARDYQARRGNIRLRRKDKGRGEYVHTLNASGLATSRIFPAIMEQFQRADGGVDIPEPLRKFLGKATLFPRRD